MAAGKFKLFKYAKKQLLNGYFDLDTNSFKMALVTSATRIHAGFLGTSTLCKLSDFTQVANGNGYTTDGQAVTLSLTDVEGPGVVDFSAITAGSGYTSAPSVSFSGGGGSGAAATAYIDAVAGTVTGLEVTAPGTGYTSAPSVSFSGGGGTSAAATAVLQRTVAVAISSPDPANWTSSTFDAKYAIIYRSDDATKSALAYCDLELQKALGLSPSAGTLAVDTAGIFDLI